jgi:Cupin-like domain
MQFVAIDTRQYDEQNLEDLLKGRLPVKITGFSRKLDRNGIRELRNRITALSPDAYFLEGNNLSVSAKTGITVTPGKDTAATTSGYRAKTLHDAPHFFSGIIPIPFACDRSFFFKSRVWLAGKNIRTPLHRDIPHNLILILSGCKSVKITAPGKTRYVYSNHLFSRAPNFALLNLHEPDLLRFPKAETLLVHETVLRRGDMLYLPPLWWHDLKNLETTISANFWFAPAGLHAIAGKLTHFLNSALSFWSRAN